MLPLVTVIIPSYNCEAYISDTIDCVLAQSYSNIELIIVDDGSTDNTQNIIHGYGDKLTLICKENAGVCAARNLGIQKASGEYICLLDHDDYWFTNKIAQQLELFKTHPDTGVVYSHFACWSPDKVGAFPAQDSVDVIPISNEIDHTFSGWIYHLLLLDCWVLTSTAMIHADVFKTCGFFDENLPYSEDWDLWLRISRNYPFTKLKGTTTLYRQHPQQGNKKVRPIDYRTQLLINSKNKWGLCSPDGRCLSKWEFSRQLAEYHAGYGLYQLIAGYKKQALLSLFKAWLQFPIKFKYIAYILACILGWKPNW